MRNPYHRSTSAKSLTSLLKILRLSTSLTTSISTTAFFRRLSESLDRNAKAVVKLNLLRLIRVVCDNHPDRATLVSRFDLARIVDRLGKQDDAVLVRELAKELHPSLLFGNDPPMGVVPTRVLNTVKRTTGDSAKSDAMRKQVIGPDREGVEGKTGVSLIIPGKGGENPKHKRKISRSQLRYVIILASSSGALS